MTIGLIGKKIGMTREFFDSGISVPVTVLYIEKGRILDVITKEKRGYNAIQVGFEKAKSSKLTKSIKGFFAKKATEPKKILKEFRVDNIVDFKPKWPTTGIVGMHFATLHFDEVYLYGFDTYDKKYDNLHYFEDKPNKYKDESKIDHEPSKEKKFIKYIKENHNVKLLEEVLWDI